MTPHHECIVTGGGSASKGELRIWQNLNHDIAGQVFFGDHKPESIYGVSISPSGRYLAAGSKTGLVRIWLFLDQELQEKPPFLFEIYHQLGPVTALAFLTDDLLLSAGVNGKIRVISISRKKHLKDLDAHSGAICSLIALSSRVVASLGFDGNIKIWDMDSLTCEFQAEGFSFPNSPHNLFPALAFSQETGYLCCPSAKGKLHLFDLQNLCSQEAFQAHQSAFYAMTTSEKYLVTGGVEDGMLKLWDLGEKKLFSEIEAGTSFLRLCSIGKEKIAAIGLDPNKSQSIRIFQLPSLRPFGVATKLDIRSIATLPLPIVEQRCDIELTRLKKNLIDNARTKIKNPEQMEQYLKQLVEKGFWAEAKLLQAESARLRGKPLHELGFLLQLTNSIKISESTAPVFHRLALLLEQLNEPKLALQNYEKIRSHVEGIEKKLETLKVHTLAGLDPEKTIRTDISPVEFAIQEMEKDSVLQRRFRWRLIIPCGEHLIFKIQALHSLDHWEDHIHQQISSQGRNVEMEQETIALFDGFQTKKFKLLRLSHIGSRCPSAYLDYAIEINPQSKLAQGYGIFNPSKKGEITESAAIHNASLVQAYRTIYRQRETERWLNQVHEAMKQLDKQVSFKRS